MKQNQTYTLLKRGLDLGFGIIGLTLFFLIFPFIALLIKIESPGPVFFFQTRVGQYGKYFKFVKFRTMQVDAFLQQGQLDSFNETGGPTFKMKSDPRITKIGRLLRITSIDEFPQFWLVLIGKMSLVGPRPPLISEVERYTDNQKLRMTVPQGMTGLWQVRGRSNLKFGQATNLDVYYALNCNFWLDIQIIFQTIPAIILGRGAR